jgi:ankyrin repeat protein
VLQTAVLQSDPSEVLQMIANGAKHTAKPGGQTALMLAAYRGCAPIVEALLDAIEPAATLVNGPNAKHSTDGGGGKTAAMYALIGWDELNKAAHGKLHTHVQRKCPPQHTRVLELITDHASTDVTVQDDSGASAITLCVKVRVRCVRS